MSEIPASDVLFVAALERAYESVERFKASVNKSPWNPDASLHARLGTIEAFERGQDAERVATGLEHT